MESWKEELLMSLLKCGYSDLNRLNEVLAIARKFDITIDEVVYWAEELANGQVKFNDVMTAAMSLILHNISDYVDDLDMSEKIWNHKITVNYMDSWFNIKALDKLRDIKEIEKMTKEQIVEQVVKEVIKGEKQ
ncbi:MAG: hypothetical protein MRT15_08255 [archaeon YNP-LCB-003-016]|uniref:hypothetical protein n=1 Tax=Candidatus Culexarchaeum yellowstonense TaxID=2928963 RepID=UPI0026EB37F3|nr:hypothetical protein [Candidatus Culexarchaeum yellowstonense]MCR6692369.1 hypothetical protein [Candidatus Culexarchaeum yellowstonense]